MIAKPIFKLFFVFWISNIPRIQGQCDTAPIMPHDQNEITMKVFYQAQTDDGMIQICAHASQFRHLKVIFLPSIFNQNKINTDEREQACAAHYVDPNYLFSYACCRLNDQKETAECAKLVKADSTKISKCAEGQDTSFKPDDMLHKNGAEADNLPSDQPNPENLPILKFNEIPDWCTMDNALNNFVQTVCLMFKEKKRPEPTCKNAIGNR